jgi:integrase/recombinase XerD
MLSGPFVRKVDKVLPGQPCVELVDATGTPVPEVSGFLRLLAVRDYSPNTVRAYAHDLQKLFRFLDEHGLRAEEFKAPRAVEFIEWLRTRSSARKAQRLNLALAAGDGRLLAARTCNRVLAAVSSFYEYLISVGQYGGIENPVVKVTDEAARRVPDRPRPPLPTSVSQRPVRKALRIRTVQTLPRPMSAETYAALLAVLRSRRDRAMLELMWEGGLRPGEVLGLRLEDISYGRRRIMIRFRTDHPAGVRQKSRRDRPVDLLEGRALPAVSDYVMRERPAEVETGYVFLVGGRGRRRHEPLSYDGLVRMFARASLRAGVRDPWLTPHALRHTHATRMFEGGMRDLTLMTRLGHASPDSTKIYTRVGDKEVVNDYRRAIGEPVP